MGTPPDLRLLGLFLGITEKMITSVMWKRSMPVQFIADIDTYFIPSFDVTNSPLVLNVLWISRFRVFQRLGARLRSASRLKFVRGRY